MPIVLPDYKYTTTDGSWHLHALARLFHVKRWSATEYAFNSRLRSYSSETELY